MIDPDLPAARLVLVVVLAALVAVLVWRAVRKDRREYRRFKRFRSSAKRQAMYRKWLIDSFTVFGGASVVVLALVWQFVPLLRDEVDGWTWVRGVRSAVESTGAVGTAIAAVIIGVVVIGSVLAIVLARKVDVIPAVGDIAALLPRNRAELGYGAALSINAGVVEELLFRLALPALLFGVTSSAAVAVVGSLLVFGALHVYQGAPRNHRIDDHRRSADGGLPGNRQHRRGDRRARADRPPLPRAHPDDRAGCAQTSWGLRAAPGAADRPCRGRDRDPSALTRDVFASPTRTAEVLTRLLPTHTSTSVPAQHS